MITFLLVFVTSLLVVSFSIPSIINVAFLKRLFDAPDCDRKIHKKIIPNLGGVAIFTGSLFSTSVFVKSTLLPESNSVLAAGIILFIIGLKDDLVGLSPFKKFMAQFMAAFLLAVLGNIRITNFHGLLGITEISYPFSLAFSVITIVAVINAFNLIDGIDGLAGGLGVLVSIFYAIAFYMLEDYGWACLSISLTGAIIGFLFYNVSPARIFMGDTGSLIIGMFAAIFSIHFVESCTIHAYNAKAFGITAAPALAIAVLLLPLFDTFRVIILRILNSDSPFKADRNHLHHRLLDMNLNHTLAAILLIGTNLLFIIFCLAFTENREHSIVVNHCNFCCFNISAIQRIF